jgi:hypothetical protein
MSAATTPRRARFLPLTEEMRKRQAKPAEKNCGREIFFGAAAVGYVTDKQTPQTKGKDAGLLWQDSGNDPNLWRNDCRPAASL